LDKIFRKDKFTSAVTGGFSSSHLESILVKVGERVALGSPVGKLGSTGRSTGPHVHYEVWFDNRRAIPKTFWTLFRVNWLQTDWIAAPIGGLGKRHRIKGI